jgi:hypothetical protein
MTTRFVAVFAALILVPLAASAAEKYTLKIDKPAQVGDRAKHTIHDNTEMKFTLRNTDGVVVAENTDAKDTRAIYEETILAKEGDKRANKLSRKYESITSTKDVKKLDLDLVGKVVIIERNGAEHKFQYEGGGAVAGDTLEYLKEEFKNKDDEDRKMERGFMPKVPVAVGETWKCDMVEIVNSFGKDDSGSINKDKSNATGKLLRVYSKDGATFGVVETTINLLPTKVGNANFKADAGSKMVFKLTLDACIDGSRTEGTMSGGMTVDFSGSLSQGGMDFTMKVTGKGKISHTQTPLK